MFAGGRNVIFGELERCAHCHQRYPSSFGHRCPQASFARQRGQQLEDELRAWLGSNEGRFAAYLAKREREA